MEMTRVWPLLCQFGVGGVLCVIGVWAGLKSKYLDLKLHEDRSMLIVIFVGFLALFVLSSLFTFVLPFTPAEAC